MVLHGFLEDFLHGASTSRRVNNASLGYAKDAVFADAIIEIFGDVGSEWCGWFVSIKPSRYSEANVLILRVFLHDLDGGF